ncbi:hypothetical protein HOD38_04800 [archaeon]|mgnify:FL=1|jgi:hypothetical protein|nr:hypothetical protein [archaeon]MBT4397561.1 hypothetical protein [archaeon]MBT4440816.1 hypothetical protein [archaeon]
MYYDILLENIRRIINKTEVELTFSLRENLETMYWEIGFELKELSSKNLKKIMTKLSKDLEVNQSILEISYDYYRNHQVHTLREKK